MYSPRLMPLEFCHVAFLVFAYRDHMGGIEERVSRILGVYAQLVSPVTVE